MVQVREHLIRTTVATSVIQIVVRDVQVITSRRFMIAGVRTAVAHSQLVATESAITANIVIALV